MNPRFRALELIQTRSRVEALAEVRAKDVFGSNAFSLRVMKNYLSKEAYSELQKCIEQGETISRSISGQVANAMKTWAIENGCSHFTHWFQPLTGLTAEKHDSFLELQDGEAIEKFSEGELVQQEPDASSFPNGGLRNTFEARGYTAWDPVSPAFIFESKYGKTLCIPSIFVSYTGEALDYKAPLLKSIALLEKAAVDVCQFFDKEVTKVIATLGVEQEYFLIDRSFYELRPDLSITGRTLFGAAPARGQQLEDHYFGSISSRVMGFMVELEREAHKIGIPLKTRHNEVAPSQFECAPIFEEMNLAIDHAQILMDLMEKVASKHNFRALLHEKPYAHINGSGKHNNWSMATNTGKNLLSPGKEPKENLMFLAFLSTVVKAVFEHADLLRASIASAGNDHRLGANEAPPAIISVFLGTQLTDILNEIINPPRTRNKVENNPYMQLGIRQIPDLKKDNTDRNRTSPFAFTGNKFEFRAVGSSANSANAMTILNLIVANQLGEFKRAVDKKVAKGRKLDAAILDIIKDYIESSEAIRFEGNGYSDEWVEEAAKRGLSNVKQTPQALAAYISDKTMRLFVSHKICTQEELHARYEIMLESYLKKVAIESRVMEELISGNVIPAAIRYQKELLSVIEAMADVDMSEELYATQKEMVTELSQHIANLMKEVKAMVAKRTEAEAHGHADAQAVAFATDVFPYFDKIRHHVDALELLTADEYWTLPKYREMLFVR
ncbi:MAG: glutamine synthetase III [Bacteroidia bacterium]